jgi:hypothetical protein
LISNTKSNKKSNNGLEEERISESRDFSDRPLDLRKKSVELRAPSGLNLRVSVCRVFFGGKWEISKSYVWPAAGRGGCMGRENVKTATRPNKAGFPDL